MTVDLTTRVPALGGHAHEVPAAMRIAALKAANEEVHAGFTEPTNV